MSGYNKFFSTKHLRLNYPQSDPIPVENRSTMKLSLVEFKCQLKLNVLSNTNIQS